MLTPPFLCSSLFCKTHRSHFFHQYALIIQMCTYAEWHDLVIFSFNLTLKLNWDSGIPGLWTRLCRHNFLDPGFQNLGTENQIFWIKFFLEPWKFWMKRSLPYFLFISVCLIIYIKILHVLNQISQKSVATVLPAWKSVQSPGARNVQPWGILEYALN